MDDYEFGQRDKATWMWWFACLGGLVGMSAGYGLAWVSEMSWEIDTGGLPVFAWWPNLIIMFELTMLGAIIATVATLVVSALLPSRGRTLYDPEVTTGGKIRAEPRRRGKPACGVRTGSRAEPRCPPPGASVKTV